MMFEKYCLAVVLLCMSICADAQNAVVSAGGDAKSVEGGFSFTVGQVGYTYYVSANELLASGIQSSKVEYGELTSARPEYASADKKLKVTVSPNPTHDICSVIVPNKQAEYNYTISNILGKQLVKGKFKGDSRFSLATFSKGIYLLSISNTASSDAVTSVRIVKE